MRTTLFSTMRRAVIVMLALTQTSGLAASAAQEPHRPIPQSLLEEHAEIVMTLRSAVERGGAVGPAAREVLLVLEPHVRHEQQLALAPLRLLPRLADGERAADMDAIVAVTDRLRAELPALRGEHLAIRRRLEALWEAAWREGRPEYAFVADRINRHIKVDEDVLFPAALLVGDYVRLARASESK